MSLPCPRCGDTLKEEQAQDVVLSACASCGGLWLDPHGAARVSEALCAWAREVADAAVRGAGSGVLRLPPEPAALAVADAASGGATRRPDQDRTIDCPVCAEILIRGKVSGVEIDRCPDHGAWYDRDELRKIAQAMQGLAVEGRRPAQQQGQGAAQQRGEAQQRGQAQQPARPAPAGQAPRQEQPRREQPQKAPPRKPPERQAPRRDPAPRPARPQPPSSSDSSDALEVAVTVGAIIVDLLSLFG